MVNYIVVDLCIMEPSSRIFFNFFSSIDFKRPYNDIFTCLDFANKIFEIELANWIGLAIHFY